MAKSGRLELGDNFTDNIGLYSTTATYLARKKSKSARKRKISAITPFKVIQGHRGRYQSKARMRLPMINSNWHPISYRFGDIAAYSSNFGHCVFEPPFGGLGTTYDVHLRLIGERVVDFLLVIIELFFARCYSWGATSEKRSKIGDFASTRLVWHKFQVEGDVPHQ